MERHFRFAVMLVAAAGLLAGPLRSQAHEPLMTYSRLGTCLHPIQKPHGVCYPACCLDQPCCCCKDRVHIFAVNGMDPCCLGNFNGLCHYLREQGFTNTYFGQLLTLNCYAQKIRAVREADPCARIVLIGFSLGCNYVRCLANRLAREGVHVDLLVYLAGDSIHDAPRSFPDNVGRVLNLPAHGLILTGGDLLLKGADIDGARNCRLDTRHILVPSRQQTLELLMEELLALACVPCR